jgi:hypothetical protein
MEQYSSDLPLIIKPVKPQINKIIELPYKAEYNRTDLPLIIEPYDNIV